MYFQQKYDSWKLQLESWNTNHKSLNWTLHMRWHQLQRFFRPSSPPFHGIAQLADLFNLSFMTHVFPSIYILKTAKVVPHFKKDSKLDYSNYHPVSLLSNIEKMLEKIMYKRLCTFLNKNDIYNLQFGFRQQYFTSHLMP